MKTRSTWRFLTILSFLLLFVFVWPYSMKAETLTEEEVFEEVFEIEDFSEAGSDDPDQSPEEVWPEESSDSDIEDFAAAEMSFDDEILIEEEELTEADVWVDDAYALISEGAELSESVRMSDDTIEISGTVRVSKLAKDAQYITLTGDTELIVDENRQVRQIQGPNKTLTISGDGKHTLTVYEFSPWSPVQDVAAVQVNNLIMNSGILDAKGQGQGVQAGKVTVNGGKLISHGYMYGMEVSYLEMNDGELECLGEYVIRRGKERLIGLLARRTVDFNGGKATITGRGKERTDGDYGIGIEVSEGTLYREDRHVAFNGGTVRVNGISDTGSEGVTLPRGGSVFIGKGDFQIYVEGSETSDCTGIKGYEKVELDNWGSSKPLVITAGSTAHLIAIEAEDIELDGFLDAGGMIDAKKNLTVKGGIITVNSRSWGMDANETLTLHGIVDVTSELNPLYGKEIIIGGTIKATAGTSREKVEAVLCPPITLYGTAYGHITFVSGSLEATSPKYLAIVSREIHGDSCFLKVERPADGKIKKGTVIDSAGTEVSSAKIVAQVVSVSIKDGTFYQGDTLELQLSNMPAGGWNTQWQCSEDNENWTDISGATNDYYTTVSGDGGKYFRAALTAKGSYYGTVYTESKFVNKAVWKVSFAANGGSGSMDPVLVEKGASMTLPECIFTPPSGKSFVRWDYGKPGASYTPSGNVTIKAIWIDDYYTFTFDSNGGSGTMQPVTIERGGTYTLPENGFKAPPGSTFRYWNVYGANFIPGRVITVTRSDVVKPIWRMAKVSYNANGGTGSMPSYTLPEGTDGKFTLPECGFTAPTGKQFDRWDLGSPGTVITITNDITLKALWKTRQYTVTFDKNGGGGTMDDLTMTGSLVFTLPECGFTAPEGKTFSMWYVKDAVTSYKLYSPGDSVEVTGNTSVQALWRIKEADSHTVYFDSAEGSGEMASVTLANRDEYYLPECRFKAPEGKRFLYWNVQEIRDGSISASIGYKDPGAKITMNNDYNIRAVWTDIVYVTVSFIMDGHGTDMKPETQTVDDRECVQKPEDPSEEGWIFEGWYPNRRPGTPLFDFARPLNTEPNKDYVSSKQLTLYARWTQKKYSVYLGYSEHGTASLSQGLAISGVTELETAAGKAVSVSAEPDEDYVIDKITYTAADGDPQDITKSGYFTMPMADVAVSVLFKPREYSVNITPGDHGTAAADPSSAAPGTIITLTPQPDTGYQFVKWEVLEGGDLSIGEDGRFEIGKADVRVKPVFEPETYEVKFETNGGSAIAPLTVKYGETFEKPADPAKADSKFAGWYADSTLKTPYDLAAAVTGPIILYAKWESTVPAVITGEIKPDAPISAETVEETILSQKNDDDLKGSSFSILQLKGVPKSNTVIQLKWKKVPGAKEYVIYGNKCGKNTRYKRIKAVTGTSCKQKKLKKGTYYKYLVVAVNGNKALAASKTIHVATKGGKVGNNTKVTITRNKKKVKKLSLTAGKSTKIKTTIAAGKLRVSIHRKVKFESDNPAVATVSGKGKIKAVAKGTCYIYAYAQNGVLAKVKVEVN